jgi:hypothetical protein
MAERMRGDSNCFNAYYERRMRGVTLEISMTAARPGLLRRPCVGPRPHYCDSTLSAPGSSAKNDRRAFDDGHRPEIVTFTRSWDSLVAQWPRSSYIHVHGHDCRYRPGDNKLALRDLWRWGRKPGRDEFLRERLRRRDNRRDGNRDAMSFCGNACAAVTIVGRRVI